MTLHSTTTRWLAAAFCLVLAGGTTTWAQNAETDKQDKSDEPLFFYGGEDRQARKLIEGNGSLHRFDKHSGEVSILLERGLSRTKLDAIEVDPEQKYRVSIFMKSRNEDEPANAFVVIKYFTEEWRPITPQSIHPVSNVSELTAEAAKGSKTVSVSKWKWQKVHEQLKQQSHRLGAYSIVFNAKEDESDLPNWDHHPLSSIVSEDDDSLVFELKAPLDETYAAGTNVRVHRYQDFPTLGIKELPAEWTEYTLTLGELGNLDRRVWPSARYAAVQIMTRKAPLLWDDLKVEKLD